MAGELVPFDLNSIGDRMAGGFGGGGGFLGGMGGLLGGMFTGGLGPILSGLGGLLGGFSNAQEVAQTRSDINNMAEYNPFNFNGPAGQAFFGDGVGSFQLSPQQQAMQAILGTQGSNLLAGGLFNSPQLQAALGQNDIAGALGQANQALGMQARGSFMPGQLSNLMGGANALANQFMNQTAQGPQDFSGGMQSSLFSRGAANQQAAGNQQALFNQSLATQRAAAQPLFDRQLNRVQDSLFAKGMLGNNSTQTGEAFRGLFEAQNQADLGFQNNAFGQAQQQQQLLSNLGLQQTAQGAGLLGQNLNQFNTGAQLANSFLGLGGQLEAQGFGQNLSALQQNQSAGLQRLQAAQGLFGLGSDVFAQNFGLGIGAQQQLMDQGRFGLENILGLMNAESGRIGATGQHAESLASLTNNSGGMLGNLLGGLF